MRANRDEPAEPAPSADRSQLVLLGTSVALLVVGYVLFFGEHPVAGLAIVLGSLALLLVAKIMRMVQLRRVRRLQRAAHLPAAGTD